MPARVDKKAGPGEALGSRQTEEARISLLASIVDSSDDGVIAMTLDGIITSWNHGAEVIYGYSADEIIGKPRWILAHATQPNAVDGTLQQIRGGGRVEHYETLRVRKDGTAISVSLTVSPILDPSGNLIGVSSISRDVTEQRQASQYARSLIEASFDPLVIISPEGKITDINEATIRVTGVDRQGLVGTDFFDYFTEPEKARESYKEVFEKGDVADYPLTIRAKDGRLTDV
ncbi:MAG: PAS domain S-box protein, partial [Actinomycetota bacterium]